MSVLTVSNATKTFGKVTALDGASFELAEGELLALLGPNGAGKTTLIRAITGRVRLDSGEIRLFDRVLAGGHTPHEVGVVPQEVALYPLLTARENLHAFGRLQGLSGRVLAQQVDWVLERTGLADRSAEPIKQFSGGMRRRLNIACGIVHRPRVVLLDEPTVGVDPQSRDRIYDVLADLRSTGVSLLLTTHHLEEAEARCSRTVIIDHGKVIASGTLPELVDRTVGRHRLVTLRMDAPLASAVFTSGATSIRQDSGIEVDAADPRVLRARLADVGLELPPLLDSLRQAGRTVEDLDVRGPSLQAVFIHLTGRELRE
jgi:linearmycin/streptolysin S transport system ATP-binding protein